MIESQSRLGALYGCPIKIGNRRWMKVVGEHRGELTFIDRQAPKREKLKVIAFIKGIRIRRCAMQTLFAPC